MRRLLSWLLQAAILVPLLLAALIGSTLLFVQSARWTVEPVAGATDATFFVAFLENGRLGVEPLRGHRRDPPPGVDYLLAPGRHDQVVGTSAQIEVEEEGVGTRRVRVFVVGDVPFSSLSEYRVRGNAIEPLAHGRSSGAAFIAAFAALGLLAGALTHFAAKRINRWLRLAPGTDPVSLEN